MLWFFLMFIVSMLGLILFLAYIENAIYNIPDLEETDLERKCHSIKMHIADMQWKMRKNES